MKVKNTTIILCALLVLLLSTISVPSAELDNKKPHERLTGTWANEFFTATFDWKSGTYSGQVFDKKFRQPLYLIKEEGNIIVFDTSASTTKGIRVEIIDDNHIVMIQDFQKMKLERKSVGIDRFSNNKKTDKKTLESNRLPSFSETLKGNNEVRIKNPNGFEVTVALRSGGRGKNFQAAANGMASVFVPNGSYEIYFVYSSKPDALFKRDDFSLNDNGIEIQIVKVVGGNYGIRQIK